MKSAVVMVAALALAACGDDSGSATGGGSTTDPATTSATDDGLDTTAAAPGTTSGAEGDSDSGPGPMETGSESGVAEDPSWHTLAPLPGGPRQETAVAELDGLVYVVGGFLGSGAIVPDTERYDPSTDAWTTTAPAPAALHHAQLAAHGDRLYLLGSLRGFGFDRDGASWAYDPVDDAWTEVAEMPLITARGGGGAATIEDRIYVIGGLADGQAVADAWTYEPGADTWLPIADMPTPRDHLGVATVGGLLYAVGGRDGSIGGHTDRVDVYDPARDTWSEGPPMPTSRGGVAIGASATTIFVAGGEGNADSATGVFEEFEAFDAASDSWSSLPPMPVPRHGTGGVVVGARFYVPGGATVEALGAVEDHEAWGP
ncbi:MAG: kelch repeat-containing protein [Myxococcota bacterium]